MSIEDDATMAQRTVTRINELERFLKALEDVEDLFRDEFEEYLSLVKHKTIRLTEVLQDDLKEYDR